MAHPPVPPAPTPPVPTPVAPPPVRQPGALKVACSVLGLGFVVLVAGSLLIAATGWGPFFFGLDVHLTTSTKPGEATPDLLPLFVTVFVIVAPPTVLTALGHRQARIVLIVELYLAIAVLSAELLLVSLGTFASAAFNEGLPTLDVLSAMTSTVVLLVAVEALVIAALVLLNTQATKQYFHTRRP